MARSSTTSTYLDQIAPKRPRSSWFKFGPKLFILIGVGGIALVIILVSVSSAINDSRRQPWQELSAKLGTIEKVTASAKPSLKNGQLRSLNSELTLFVTNTKRDIATPLTTVGVDAKSLPESVTKKEATDSVIAELEEARLKAQYDSTYLREMTAQLATTLALLRELYSNTDNETLKAFLKTSYDNLQPIYESLDSLTIVTG